MTVKKNSSPGIQDPAFLQPTLAYKGMETYIIRKSILEFITRNLKNFNGRLLDIGCGKMPYKNIIQSKSNLTEYVGIDIETASIYDSAIRPDLYWDGTNMPIESESFDCAIATEVLEHVPTPATFLKETYRILKKGGTFYFTVPFIWNLHEVPFDEYRYTPFALERVLKENGFSEVEIMATGGWHASMATMLGLWVKRSPMSIRKKKVLATICIPIMKYLLRKDKQFDVKFREGQMITGLCGYAKKI